MYGIKNELPFMKIVIEACFIFKTTRHITIIITIAMDASFLIKDTCNESTQVTIFETTTCIENKDPTNMATHSSSYKYFRLTKKLK